MIKKPKGMSQEMKNRITKDFRGFYRETLGGLRRTVSMSMKGTPRKQAWGMHIERPYIKNQRLTQD